MSRPSRCNPRTVLHSRIGRQFQAIAGAPAGRPHAASTHARSGCSMSERIIRSRSSRVNGFGSTAITRAIRIVTGSATLSTR